MVVPLHKKETTNFFFSGNNLFFFQKREDIQMTKITSITVQNNCPGHKILFLYKNFLHKKFPLQFFSIYTSFFFMHTFFFSCIQFFFMYTIMFFVYTIITLTQIFFMCMFFLCTLFFSCTQYFPYTNITSSTFSLVVPKKKIHVQVRGTAHKCGQ